MQVQLIHVVEVGHLRDGDLRSLHTPGGVGLNEQRTGEAHVVAVVGREIQLIALRAGNVQSVHDEIAVERYGMSR